MFQAAGIPIPRTAVFWRFEEAMAFFRQARYPLVIKLSFGFRGNNVGLLRSRAEAEAMARRLFGPGLATLQPSRFASLRDALRPIRAGLCDLLGTEPTRSPLREQSCMLVQEFIPGNDYDTRVNVIGDRAFAWRRGNAPNDFRASGAGRQDVDPAKIDQRAVGLAYGTARALGMRTAAVDMLCHDGEFVVSEVSYYFEPFLVRRCIGHWLFDGDEPRWVDGVVEPETAILEDFLLRLTPAGLTATG
ncbi:MAG TPA: hypothetical protein VK843_13695 [Planctomycetota bacterium]|nr:hypothetical protein [Planctomycetota bacterium]